MFHTLIKRKKTQIVTSSIKLFNTHDVVILCSCAHNIYALSSLFLKTYYDNETTPYSLCHPCNGGSFLHEDGGQASHPSGSTTGRRRFPAHRRKHTPRNAVAVEYHAPLRHRQGWLCADQCRQPRATCRWRGTSFLVPQVSRLPMPIGFPETTATVGGI